MQAFHPSTTLPLGPVTLTPYGLLPDASDVPLGLSVVVPCFNEAAGISELYRRLKNACREAVGDDHEIVLVDDGSTDGTWRQIGAFAEADSRVVGVKLTFFNTLLFPAVVAAKVLSRTRGARRPHVTADERLAPGNVIAKAIVESEKYLIPRMTLPTGVSLLAVARPIA